MAEQLPRERVLLYLRAVLESSAVGIIGHNLGFSGTVLAAEGVRVARVEQDLEVASFLMNAERKSHDLEGMALTWLRHKLPSLSAAIEESGGDAHSLSVEAAAEHMCARAQVLWLLREQVDKDIDERELGAVYLSLIHI